MLNSLLLASVSFAQTPQEEGRLPRVVAPVHQRVELEIDPEQPVFEGRVEITFDVPQRSRVKEFELHGEELDIRSARILGRNTRKRGFDAEVVASGIDRLSVTPAKTLRPGRYVLVIAYEGKIHDQAYGLYRFEHGGKHYVVSQLEADEARTAWPCFDEPAYKAPWQLVVTHPRDVTAISNAPIDKDVASDTQRLVEFAWTPPIPSYAVALAVGPFVPTRVDGMEMPSTIWTLEGRKRGAEALVRELPRVTRYLRGWFGSPYPYAKLDFIAVPKFPFGAMENPGAVVIQDGLLYPAEAQSPEGHSRLIEVVAHEVAHMWFGNLVTFEWWDDLWLNEAFASWMGKHTLHELAPDYREDVARVRRLTRMVHADGAPTSRPLRVDEIDPSAVFSSTTFAVYAKGEALLDMIEVWISPETLQRSLRAYLERYAWGNADQNDLFEVLQEVSGGAPIREVLQGFLDEPGAPELALKVKGSGRLVIEQSRYNQLGNELEGGPWTIPLNLRVGRPDGTVDLVRRVIEDRREVIDLGGEAKWVHPAAHGIGYFAWTLDERAMEALLADLSLLDAAERRSVLGSLALQVEAGKMDVRALLETLETFAGEEDPAMLRELVGTMSYADVALDLGGKRLQETMQAWRRVQLRPFLDAIGIEPQGANFVDTQRLRRSLLEVLAEAEDPDVLEYGRRVGKTFLETPGLVDPELGRWGLWVLAREGDMKLHRQLLQMAQTERDTERRQALLFSAGAVPGDRARDGALEAALSERMGRRPLFGLLAGVASTRKSDEDQGFMLDWVIANYDALSEKLSPPFRALFARSGEGCDLERFQRSAEFFATQSIPGVGRVLSETEASVRACIARRDLHGPSVKDYLKDWARRQ